ncbi:uncharacterized protein LOC129611701 isoform X2 [Condylostylus longicornis]|nr:uncharacterized protein LOC129611701 isoform X2 [Condylostylus longicornis]XP_055380972.1 uncharacterized protein LOC129611701 isoform X2 [Condylostylus longicornis]
MLAIADSTTIPELYSENSVLGKDGRISLAYENLQNIPPKIAANFSNDTKFLDLSFNKFKDLSFLSYFKGLNTLILDKNPEPDETTLPYLPNLEILWLNNCNIINVPKWIYRIQLQCQNIKQLSLIGNPGARTLLTGANAMEEYDYRLFVTETLKTLTHLDGIPVITMNSTSTYPTVPQSQQRTEIITTSLLQHQTTIQITKSNQYNNNNTSIFKNNTMNSTFVPHTPKLSSSTSVKSFYLHNSQQQYHQHYNPRKMINWSPKDNNKSNKRDLSNSGQNKRKKIVAESFKDLFRFNSKRRNSCQSSTTS